MNKTPNTNKELAIRYTNSVDPNTANSAELAPQTPRFVIYGTRVAGAQELSDLIASKLEDKGVATDAITYSRSVDNIENAFFNREHPIKSREADQNSAAVPLSLASRAIKLLGGSSLKSLRHNYPGDVAVPVSTTGNQELSTPTGVFVFPEMRQYSENGAVGMTIDTPLERIEELCSKYNVPLVRVERTSDPAELVQEIGEITA